MLRMTAAGLPLTRSRLNLNTLELFLPPGWPDRPGPVHWCVSGSSPAHGEVAHLDELPSTLRWAALIVWTPPADTLLTHVTLPTRSARKIAQALPYALEDRLLADPEGLHFAYQRVDDGTLAVAVTARERLATWTQTLQRAGLHPGSLCPATLAVPMDVEDWAAAFVGELLWVRRGAHAGFSCVAEIDAPPKLLQAALSEVRGSGQAPLRLTLFNAPAGLDVQRWAQALDLEVVRARSLLWEERLAGIAPLNLLQGEFAPSRGVRARLRPLLPAAIMVAVWLLATLAMDTSEWWRLQRTQHAYQQNMSALFRQAFPDSKVVLDPALQMERNLGALRARGGQSDGSGLLAVLASIVPALRAETRLDLRALRYADAKLTLDLRLPDFEALERTKNAMAASGRLRIEVLGATRQASAVEGRLRVEAAPTSGVSNR